MSHIVASFTENNFSLLRSKIFDLHLVCRESLGALLRHLSRVASHSDKNGMGVEVLATRFCYPVLHGSEVLDGFINAKARCIDLNFSIEFFQLIPPKRLVMNDLIQNVHALFDEPTPSSPVSSNVTETTPTTHPYDSLFSSSELRQSTISTSAQLSSSSLPSVAATDCSRTSSLTGLLSPKTLTDGVEMSMQEQVIPKVRGVETLGNSEPAKVVAVPLTSVTEWRLQQSQLSPQPEGLTIPQNPPESMLSSTSDVPFSSATSLQTRPWGFSA
jgi:hypothetical protein